MKNRLRNTLRAGSLAAVAMGATVLVAGPALAAGPTLGANPSSGLSGGQTITVSGQGYTPGSKVGVAECDLDFSKRVACDRASVVTVTVGQDGRFSTPVTVQKTFKGYNLQTGQETGAVNAATDKVGLTAVLMSQVAQPLANLPLSFA
ncbi:enediyne antibiotic chromoprotein [Streptomyces sp. NPDC001678]|uniref:enediyne antibiotic chromoprotein n=1 Tax=Streptomyces sp. NPDC001678 TaxID=3364599 RepID=UPI003691A40B